MISFEFNLSPVFNCGLEPLKGEPLLDRNMNSLAVQCWMVLLIISLRFTS